VVADVSELISKASQQLGPDASDEEISEKVREAIEALPEADRAQVLEQLVKGVSSGQLRRLDKEVDLDRQEDLGTNRSNTEPGS
jgi:DNA-directed RNA polymerase specialized sigma24 family protein